MTDELIEAVARAICKAFKMDCGFSEEGADYAASNEWLDWSVEARAAISVIAPAVLEEAAKACENYMSDCLEDRDVQRNWPVTLGRNKVYSQQVRALKTRYEA